MLCRLILASGNAVLVPQVLEGYFQNRDGISRATDLSLREQGEIFAKARAETSLDMMYAIDPDDPESLATGWTALGNMAFDVRVPWQPDASSDVPFAVECFERALAVVPDHLAATHNRYVALAATGRADEAERDLATLTAARSASVRGQGFALMRPAVEPRVRSPVFDDCDGIGAHASSAERSRRVPERPPDHNMIGLSPTEPLQAPRDSSW